MKNGRAKKKHAVQLNSSASEYGQTPGYCAHGNESSTSILGMEFLEQLR
jgi:predicted aspartyl protease